MKILWLAPFPYSSRTIHPAPWISSLATEIVQLEDVEITILNYSPYCKQEVEFFEYAPKINLVFVKSPGLLTDLFTLGALRIKRLKRQIRNCGPFNVIHIHGSEHQFEYCVSKKDKHAVMSIQGILSEYFKYLKPAGSIKKYISWFVYSKLEMIGLKRLNNFSCRTTWDKSIVQGANPDARFFNIWEVIRAEFTSNNKACKGNNIYFTGGSNPLKGLNTAINAFTAFKKCIKSDVQLVVVGNVKEAEREKIQKDVADADIYYSILFTGVIGAAEIIEIQKKSFCHLHPSLIDNSPNSICESQLIGLPVIATPTGGVTSLVENGVTGFLATDVDQITASLVNLYTDNNLWNQISRQSCIVAGERHNRKTIVNDTMRMYNYLINNN